PARPRGNCSGETLDSRRPARSNFFYQTRAHFQTLPFASHGLPPIEGFPMSPSALIRKFLITVLALGICAGCNGGPKRQEVPGTVVLKGKPVDEGIIDFEPLDGQPSKSGARILNGEYRIPADKGLLPGRYKVSIVAGDGTPTSGKGEPSERVPGVI